MSYLNSSRNFIALRPKDFENWLRNDRASPFCLFFLSGISFFFGIFSDLGLSISFSIVR